ncbi:aminopeptidase [Candidatus Woesearchaeota archaeon]|nr:aminopeptidase [Candidatus Woesearchaeota archaeon]
MLYAKIVLKKCLCLKRNERFLIITDSKLCRISMDFLNQAKKITDKVKLIKIPIAKVNGVEPPKDVAEEMMKCDAGLFITAKSLTHTQARKNACEHGARIATMPGINKGILKRAIKINYAKLKKFNMKLAGILNRGKKVSIKTKVGTDINFSIKGRKAYGTNSGIYNRKGSFGNLPSGEVFIAPVEGTANGIFVADASFAGIGKLTKPISVHVKDGYAYEIIGNKAKKLEMLLDSAGKNARNIAEFGIGTNKKAKVSGIVLEDEKAIGTCHIALGNNFGFGGKINVPLHIDGIIKSPSITVDGKKIMEFGRFTMIKPRKSCR